MVEVWTAEINEMLEILQRSCCCEVNDAGPGIFFFNCFNILDGIFSLFLVEVEASDWQ